MKYIKTYEGMNTLSYYDVGDYVRTEYGLNNAKNKFFKILHKNKVNNKNAYSAIDVMGVKHHLNDADIKRIMTKKEIEQYKLEITTKKYNI